MSYLILAGLLLLPVLILLLFLNTAL